MRGAVRGLGIDAGSLLCPGRLTYPSKRRTRVYDEEIRPASCPRWEFGMESSHSAHVLRTRSKCHAPFPILVDAKARSGAPGPSCVFSTITSSRLSRLRFSMVFLGAAQDSNRMGMLRYLCADSRCFSQMYINLLWPLSANASHSSPAHMAKRDTIAACSLHTLISELLPFDSPCVFLSALERRTLAASGLARGRPRRRVSITKAEP